MITGPQVLQMLIPQGGWVITGDSFDGIQFLECEPITEKQFLDGFAKVEKYEAQKAAQKEMDRKAILDRLGITADEAALLLS